MGKEVEIVGVVGDQNWKEMRIVLVIELLKCQTEKDFLKVIQSLLAGIGTPKELAKMRKALKIEAFKESELNEMNEKIKNVKKNKE